MLVNFNHRAHWTEKKAQWVQTYFEVTFEIS